MKQYIGVKMVKAWPAFRVEFPGMLPVYYAEGEIIPPGGDVQDGYRVEYEDGFRSWSPKGVFEEAYRETTGMNFGLAIEAMKNGLRVSRKHWNDNTYVILAYEPDFVTDADISDVDIEAPVHDMLVMRHPYGAFIPGWLPSTADMLADDWSIV